MVVASVIWRWRFGAVDRPTRQTERSLACFVTAVRDDDQDGEGAGQRDHDLGDGQDLTNPRVVEAQEALCT